jgi:hypothetical protein
MITALSRAAGRARLAGAAFVTGTKPPLRVRPEPITRAEIQAEIEFLEEQLNGRLDEAIEHRIAELQGRLDLRNQDGK